MNFIVKTQGQPPDMQLNAGVKTELYFEKDCQGSWKLKALLFKGFVLVQLFYFVCFHLQTCAFVDSKGKLQKDWTRAAQDQDKENNVSGWPQAG